MRASNSLSGVSDRVGSGALALQTAVQLPALIALEIGYGQQGAQQSCACTAAQASLRAGRTRDDPTDPTACKVGGCCAVLQAPLEGHTHEGQAQHSHSTALVRERRSEKCVSAL